MSQIDSGRPGPEDAEVALPDPRNDGQDTSPNSADETAIEGALASSAGSLSESVQEGSAESRTNSGLHDDASNLEDAELRTRHISVSPHSRHVEGVPRLGSKEHSDASAESTKVVTLENGKTGTAYVQRVDTSGIRNLRIQQPATDPGIHFDRDTSTLKGVPAESGTFEWRLSGQLGEGNVSLVLRITVVPDSRSLWRDRPSDPDGLFWKPDTRQLLESGELHIVAASKRGRSHAHEGLFRDDDFEISSQGNGGWYILAVADGAGSARFSREGSRLAVSFVTRHLGSALDQALTPVLDDLNGLYRGNSESCDQAIRRALYDSLVNCAFEAAKEIETVAQSLGHSAADFSTTLVVAVVRRVSSGWFVACFSIGDGGAALLDFQERSVRILSTLDVGEFAGETRFLRPGEFASYERNMERTQFEVVTSFSALTLMTDGILDPKFPTQSALENFDDWERFWFDDLASSVNLSRDNHEAGHELLSWMDFWSNGNHDDRTMLVLRP